MRGIVRNNQYNCLEELSTAAKDIHKEEYRYQEVFKNIVQSAFGKEDSSGLIAERIQFYLRNSPLQWAQELHQLVQLFSPQGNIMTGGNHSGLIGTADRSVPIDTKILPKSVLDEFRVSGDRQSSKLRNLKRQFSDKFYITNWQWFWCHIAYALINQPQLQQKRPIKQDEEEDELFNMLTRNPYLVIIRKGLEHEYRRDSLLMQRMRGVLELYFIEDLNFATKKKQSQTVQAKYHLRSHYLAAIFLLIHSRRKDMKGETLQIYHQFFIRATEYYSSITNISYSQNVRYIIRIWLYLMTRQYSIDSQLVNQAKNANPKDGWYRLSRCPLDEWTKQISKVQYLSTQVPMVLAMKKNVYKLMSRCGEWIPSFAFLAVVQQFLQFQEAVLSKYSKKQRDRQDDRIIAKCFQRNLIFLAQNGANCQILQNLQQKLNSSYKAKLQKSIEINFKVRSQEAKEKLSKTSREKMKTISYQSPRIKNVWEHPLQDNQFHIFYQLSYWTAKQIDKIIPGHKNRNPKLPCLNIRILSNPYIFFMLLFVVMLSIKWFFDL